jgi:NAD(P)-dependent dehydrogenase (short-subunit alcohol dehydrogenase family)
MKKVAAFIASGSGMGADAAKHLSSKGYDVAIMSSSGKGEELAKNLEVLDIQEVTYLPKILIIFLVKHIQNLEK